MTPALRLAQPSTAPSPQTRGRSSVALNVIEGATALDELADVRAKKVDAIQLLHQLNQLEADLLLHLQVGGRL